MRILITGSRGFLGGSVGRFSVRAGHEVLGIGRSSQPEADWRGQYIQADVAHSDLSGIIREFAPDVILHAAGTASVSASFHAPIDDLRAAILPWANTLDSVQRSGFKALVVFPSSAAVYGNPARLPVREDAPVAPISPYGFHKATCELLAREYATCFGFDIVICRFFSVFGTAQRRLLVWELYEQFVGPDSIVWLQGTGAESRDYLHIDDVTAAILELANNRLNGRRRGRCLIVNVASGEEIAVLDVAQQIGALVAPEKEIRCRGMKRQGDPRHWRADISLLRSLVPSWQPRPLSLTLPQCLAAWQKRPESFSYVF